MKHRVFVAIRVSQKLQEGVVKWTSAHPRLPVRWIAPENLHVTLIPPWYEEAIERVEVEVANALQEAHPFPIEFETVSYGPTPKNPRLIWATGTTPQELTTLAKNLHKALKTPSENRPFQLHLTIARFRSEIFSSIPLKKLDERVVWAQTVDAVELMESHLKPSGAQYETIARFP